MTLNGTTGRWSDRVGKSLVGKGIMALTCAAVAATALPLIGGSGVSLVQEASAQEARSIDSFYDDLAPYGDWVEHPDNGYVFIPSEVSPDWRPYTVGQWIWTDEYGWYWESEEPFGWATFHYGRWGYDDDYGWYWVPGDEWAPAWVNWRDSDDDSVTGWAPIAPPANGYAVGYSGDPAPPVEESWVFVPTARMVSPRVYQYAYPVRETAVYINRTPRRWYLPRDRYYVNRPFARERVVKYVGVGNVPVRRVTVVTNRPAWGVRNNDAIFVYRPRYDRKVVVYKQPKVVKKVTVVKKVKVDKTVTKKDVDVRKKDVDVKKKDVDVKKKDVDVKKTNVKEENKKSQNREEQTKKERKEEKQRQDAKQEKKQRQDAKEENKQRQDKKEEKKQKQSDKAEKQQKQEKQQQKAEKQEKKEKQQRQEAKAEKRQNQQDKAEKQQQKAERKKAKCENDPSKCN